MPDHSINALPILNAALQAIGVDPEGQHCSVEDITRVRRLLAQVDRHLAACMDEVELVNFEISAKKPADDQS